MDEDQSRPEQVNKPIPVAPSMSPTLQAVLVPPPMGLIDSRSVLVAFLAVIVAIIAAFIAEGLIHLVWFITNISFYGVWSFGFAWAAHNRLGFWVILVPPAGGIVVGIMARWGSEAIRGHGIPEAMEQILIKQSRIPARLTLLKPLSAAVAIGTGGPFGMEGPIIATGAALGSLFGQMRGILPDERKILLASGAAAGMAATFITPVSAALLSIELLLFEFRPRSLVPVSLAAAIGSGLRVVIFHARAPIFAMPAVAEPSGRALVAYLLIGVVVGLTAVVAARSVYVAEFLFARSKIHWMWWPAIGGLVVGVIGWAMPRTLGVGYQNITDILALKLPIGFIVALSALKFLSWAIALASGTSGGTLAPLFTMGGGVGAAIGALMAVLLAHWGVDVRIAALVGMAAMFVGATRAMLTSVVFAIESTFRLVALPPVLLGCSASLLISCFLLPQTIMTAKIVRRGVRVPVGYFADRLERFLVRDVIKGPLISLAADQPVIDALHWLGSGASGTEHRAFPVLDASGNLVGIVTRKDLSQGQAAGAVKVGQAIKRPPVIVYDDSTLRVAVMQMITHDVGRLPVVSRQSGKLVGMISHGDLLAAQRLVS